MNDETVYEHFRFGNPDGSTKDWAIAVASSGLRIRYGRTGSVARLAEVPSAKFGARSAEEEMRHRIAKKLDKGYFKVGMAGIVDGRLEELSPVPSHDLHWEALTTLEIGPFANALKRLSNQLSEVTGVSCQVVNKYGDSSGNENVKLIKCTGLEVTLPGRTWWFGQQVGGGLDKWGRGGGRISVHLGPIPFLILMSLGREFPGSFRFADDDGNAVNPGIAEDDPFLGAMTVSMEEIVEIGAKLGLCLGRIRLSESPGASGEQTLWF